MPKAPRSAIIPYVLIAPPDHRLAGDSDILAEDLFAERFLAREQGSGTRTLMERFLERIGGGRAFESSKWAPMRPSSNR